MSVQREWELAVTRRQLFGRTAAGIGGFALASLLNPDLVSGAGRPANPQGLSGELKALHFPPKAKHVIYLFMSGGPSHIDLFDYKPELKKHHGEELPASVRMGQRITGMTANQKRFPCVAPMFQFHRHGQSGTYVSELLPNIGKIVGRHRDCEVREYRGDQSRPGHYVHPNREPAAGATESGSVVELWFGK